MDKIMFGANIRRLRKEAGLTQEALAEKMELTQGSIGAWERGKKLPTLPHLYELANIFGVHINEVAKFG